MVRVLGVGRAGSGSPCRVPASPPPRLWPGQGGAYHSLHVVNCHCFVFSARDHEGPE